jgi:NADH:ubiquinone oxidoreductase subunit 4 (subunit M)
MITNAFNIPVLTLLIFTPILGAMILAVISPQNKQALRWVALGVSGVNFLISLTLFWE